MFNRKDLLSIRELSAGEISFLLDTAVPMKEVIQRPIKKVPALRGKTVVTLFYENSTRTRVSFELAAKHLSADSVNVSSSSSSVTKGESLYDTGRTLHSLGADVIVVRHPMAGAPHMLARWIGAAVINAGDGAHEHPTQALLDMFTVREKKGDIAGLRVVIVGDILHSRVARSDIWGFMKMGAEVRVCGPPTLVPPGLEETGVQVFYNLDDALEEADVIIMLRIQKERQQQGLFPGLGEYSRLYGLNRRRLGLAKRDALVMHPGPINRGVEISADIADCSQAVIEEQVNNGVAVRMAVLYLLTGGGAHSEAGD